MVQRKVLVPVESPETLVLARVALVNVPDPKITFQTPPAAAVAERAVLEEHIVWSVPALGESGLS